MISMLIIVFNSNFSFNGFTFDQNGYSDSKFDNPEFNLFETYRRETDGGSLFSGFDWNTDYKRTFDKKEQELVIAYQLSENTNDRNSMVDQDSSSISSRILEDNDNDGKKFRTYYPTRLYSSFFQKNKNGNRSENSHQRYQK